MTPFYIVVTTTKEGSLQKVGAAHSSQRHALEAAKDHVSNYNQKAYVFESIAEIILPRPEPIVTMKGD